MDVYGDGEYEIKIPDCYFTDIFGNYNIASDSFFITRKTTPPVVTLTSKQISSNNKTKETNIIIDIRTDVECRFDIISSPHFVLNVKDVLGNAVAVTTENFGIVNTLVNGSISLQVPFI